MGKIRKILETELVGGTQSTDVYPVTSTKAVYDTSNKVLDDYIQHLKKTSTFAGIATPTTNPGTPDGSVFYFAAEAGTYSNFSGITINTDEVAILVWNNGATWEKEVSGFASSSYLRNEVARLDETDNEIKEKLNAQKNEVNVAKEEALQAIAENEQSAITNFNSQRVTPEMLSESTKQLIEASGGGTITNLADDEDLTSVDDGTGSNVLKFADRTYNANNFSGKGYKILRKNIQSVNIVVTKIKVECTPSSDGTLSFSINGKEIQVLVSVSVDNTTTLVADKIATKLTETMTEYEVLKDASTITLTRKFNGSVTPSIFSASTTGVVCTITDSTKREFQNILTPAIINKPNTIYEIRYNFDLDGKSIIIPNGCFLRFNGGSLSNGNLVGDDTKVEFIGEYAGFNDITLLGTWSGHIIDLYFNYTEMSDAWKLIYNLTRFNSIELKREEYYIDTWKTIMVEHNFILKGNAAKLYLPSNKGEIIKGDHGNVYKTQSFIHFGYSCNNVRIEDLIILDKSELCPEGYGWSKNLIGFIRYFIFYIGNCGETNIINVRYNGGGQAVKSWESAKKTDVNIINCDFTCGGFCIEMNTQTLNDIVGCLENVRLIGCHFDLNISKFVGALSFVGTNYITNIFIRDCIIYMHGNPETFCKNIYMYNNTIYGGLCSEELVAPINALIENNTFISQADSSPYKYVARNIEFRKNTFKFEKDAQLYESSGTIDKIVFVDNNIFVTNKEQITLFLKGKVATISNNNIFTSKINATNVRYGLPFVVDELNYFHFSKYGAIKPYIGIGSENWVATTDLLTGLTLDNEGYTSINNEEITKNVIVNCPEQVCSVEIHSKKGSGNSLYVLDFKIGDKVCHLKVEYNNWNIYIGDTTGVNNSTLINADDEAVYRFTLDWQYNNNVIISIFKNDVFQKNGIINASLTGTSINITAIRGTTRLPFNRLSVLRGGVI